MYKSERELKWNDLFISAWCVLLWDSYKFRIVTSSLQFFLALFQRGRLFRFIWQKKIFLLSCSESTIYDAQSSSSSSSFMISIIETFNSLIYSSPLNMIALHFDLHKFFTFLSSLSFSVIHNPQEKKRHFTYILLYLLSLHILHSIIIYAAYNLLKWKLKNQQKKKKKNRRWRRRKIKQRSNLKDPSFAFKIFEALINFEFFFRTFSIIIESSFEIMCIYYIYFIYLLFLLFFLFFISMKRRAIRQLCVELK